MNKIQIRQLTNIPVKEIHHAFQKAFSDYVEPFDLTVDQLKYMIERRGCDLNLSFGAFSGEELVGFVLNGIGEWQGRTTAYDTGTGIVAEYRKQGIATRIFTESLPVLRKHNIKQYLLEVIKTNTGAYDLYRKAGFKASREFDYYVSAKKDLVFSSGKLSEDFSIMNIEKPNWELFKTFWDFVPSWQNSIDSIQRKRDYFSILGISQNNQIVGYGIIEKHTGDIPQIAIDASFRKKGLASVLLKNLVSLSSGKEIKIINSVCDDRPFKGFAKSLGLVAGHGQYEMLLNL